jgi:hypothetical protein
MRRLSLLAAAAGIAVTGFAAASPAEAAFHLIRWQDSGFCQIWDESIPTLVIIGSEVPTFRRRAGVEGWAVAQRHLLVLM